MADTIERTRQVRPPRVPEQAEQPRSALWQRLALGGIVLIAVFMDFFQLGQNGFGSYYPPAVRSMMDNWHNFFFASYDPGGFVTVDKPPVGFWFDVLGAKIFGFNSFSILLPQALAGVLSVLLLYYLVRRHFGVVAGLLAALALAIMPISVVTNRNITIDSILALFLLIGAWAVIRAAETGKLRWLLLSAVVVGIGFNIKMLEAYLVVHAFGLLYLLAAPKSVWKRIGYLALAGLVLLV
ncbi:MAG: glycosyltransferase family 39 protein, partial [Ktedonobacteraceae bacterium]|nr:glycosyltransferase family 39 protein [Ktedonobacteraceae bacterium]